MSLERPRCPKRCPVEAKYFVRRRRSRHSIIRSDGSPASTHHQHHYHLSPVASSPLRPAFVASRIRRFRTAFVYTRSFFFCPLSIPGRQPERLDPSRFSIPASPFKIYPSTPSVLPRTFYAWLPTVCGSRGPRFVRLTEFYPFVPSSRYSSPPAPSASSRLYSRSCF